MITEFLLNIVFTLVEWLLSPLPEMDFVLDFSGASTFFGVVRCVLYLLPLDTISSILGIMLSIGLFRIFISIVKTIWDLLPIA